MAAKNHSSPAKMLRDLHGLNLLPATEVRSEEAEVLEDKPFRRDVDSRPQGKTGTRETGTRSLVLKPEFPQLKTIWQNRPNWFNLMERENKGDRSLLETAANVATSLPFLAIGLQVPRTRPAATIYANSLIGVSIASILYHVSRGQARKVFRLGDYAMIATSSMSLNFATRDDPSKALLVASALLLPVQPVVVSFIHTGMIEATFARRAARDPKLKKARILHTLSTVVGGVLFVADDVLPQTPYIHAAWHLAAAVGIATCTKLLKPD